MTTESDAGLARLGIDYVDLYQIYRFDHEVPIDETLEALHDVVKTDKARHIGASSTYPWQFATMLYVSEANGWTRFATMQDFLNLLHREEEREMLPLCAAEGFCVIPWSPLPLCRLTRDWDDETEPLQTDEFGSTLYVHNAGTDRRRPTDVATLLARLNGTKHLVLGNNDGPATSMTDRWASVQNYAEVMIDGTLLILCHYPLKNWNGQHQRSINLNSHSHGRLKPMLRQFDVGVDTRDYRPASLAGLLH